jgi:two-component system cell cycle response regulator DivK
VNIEQSASGPSLLLIDDNSQNLRLAGFLLKAGGFLVRTAPSAEEALVLLEKQRFSLVLVDIQLPGMDGLDLTRRIRNTPAWADLPVVALTAYAMRGDEERMLAAGCDGYISKPVDTRTFANQVNEYLSGRTGSVRTADRADRSGDSEKSLSPEIALLRNQFLASASREARTLLSLPDVDLGAKPTFTTLHRWEGVGGSFELASVTALARQAQSQSHHAPTVAGPLVRPLIASILDVLESSRKPRECP